MLDLKVAKQDGGKNENQKQSDYLEFTVDNTSLVQYEMKYV